MRRTSLAIARLCARQKWRYQESCENNCAEARDVKGAHLQRPAVWTACEWHLASFAHQVASTPLPRHPDPYVADLVRALTGVMGESAFAPAPRFESLYGGDHAVRQTARV